MATTRRKRKEPKKKSQKMVWIGSGVSLLVLSLVVLIIYLAKQPGGHDEPTDASKDENLVKVELGSGLPDLGMSGSGSGNGGALLTAIASADLVGEGGYEDDPEMFKQADAVCDALVRVAGQSLSNGFYDGLVPANQIETQALTKPLNTLGTIYRTSLTRYIEDRDLKRAMRVSAAYIKLGQQMFEKNTRLKVREYGLGMMEGGATRYLLAATTAEEQGVIEKAELDQVQADVASLRAAITRVRNVWTPKLKTVESTGTKPEQKIPNIGDLIRIATKDEDPTFRVFAALRLGFARYERRDPGNEKAIEETLEELSGDSDKMVAAAAKAALAIEDEAMYHKLK